jgi:cytoskeletal protein CcmA (bactofilin family)
MALFKNESEKAIETGTLMEPQSPPRSTSPAAPLAVAGSLPPLSQVTRAPNGSGTYLDQSAKVNGKLNFEGPVRIDGQIDGEINAQDSLTIGKSAVVTAKIKAVSIIVAGTVSGEVNAGQRIELQPSAKVSGTINAPKLVVHEGAMFEGSCSMQPKAMREDRKLGPSRREERLVAENDGEHHEQG